MGFFTLLPFSKQPASESHQSPKSCRVWCIAPVCWVNQPDLGNGEPAKSIMWSQYPIYIYIILYNVYLYTIIYCTYITVYIYIYIRLAQWSDWSLRYLSPQNHRVEIALVVLMLPGLDWSRFKSSQSKYKEPQPKEQYLSFQTTAFQVISLTKIGTPISCPPNRFHKVFQSFFHVIIDWRDTMHDRPYHALRW